MYSSCHLRKLHAAGDADLGAMQGERRMKNGCLDKMFFLLLCRCKDYREEIKKRGWAGRVTDVLRIFAGDSAGKGINE